MLKRITAIALLLLATAAVAQEKATVYKLEYTVVESEGAKKLTSRAYTLLVEEGKRGFMRVGSRVPTGSVEKGYNYIDVGVNIDAAPKMIDASSVRLETTVDISSIVTEGSSSRPPVLRNCRGQIGTALPLDKVVTISTQDDPANNTNLAVQVIVKLVK